MVGHVEHPAVRREVTVCFIARLAVDRGAQGTGLGAVLLLDALERIATASELMAIRAVVVDAIDERAARFYEHFGVVRVTDQPRSLMVSLHLARAVLGESAT
ncbi:MAG TPA: GNAT family N-acetyltransferase [Solirubrobacter sp.]|nr:GNAT family N-acetyltransferase [Solirubrobacter sp.]